jgi:hypothetical protein
MSIRNDSLIYERGNLVAFLVIPSGSLLPAALLVLVMLVLIVSPWSTIWRVTVCLTCDRLPITIPTFVI